MSEDSRSSFGNPHMWDAIVAEMATRIAGNLAAQVGDRVVQRIEASLGEIASTLVSELAPRTEALRSEASRSIAVVNSLSERHDALQELVDSIGPGVEHSTSVALDAVESRLSDLTDHLLAMLSGRYMMVDREMLDTLFGRDTRLVTAAVTDLNTIHDSLDRIAAQAERYVPAERSLWSRLRSGDTSMLDDISSELDEIYDRVRTIERHLRTVGHDIDSLGEGFRATIRPARAEHAETSDHDGVH